MIKITDTSVEVELTRYEGSIGAGLVDGDTTGCVCVDVYLSGFQGATLPMTANEAEYFAAHLMQLAGVARDNAARGDA